MKRRSFFKLTGTCAGGLLLVPDFLYSYTVQDNIGPADNCVVFIQLNGGNDGLNSFIPYQDDLYYHYRPKVALSKDSLISASGGMAFHPALRGLANIQQQGNLSVIQNVGYPKPSFSHFRSQEIWNTGSAAKEFISEGWLGRFMDLHYHEHHPTAAINIDTIDNLAVRGQQPNTITVTDPNKLKAYGKAEEIKLSDNQQLDFVRKLAGSIAMGSGEIEKALKSAPQPEVTYPKSRLSKNMQWIARLIKGNLNSSIYYTSLTGFDTHDKQLKAHEEKLEELGDAVYSFYNDIKKANKLQEVTIVIFSEFGRRVADNGSGTDHGTAAPMFIIGGQNKGQIIGSNPMLSDLADGNLKHETDFRSVYAALLKDKFSFDASKIGISNKPISGIFK